MPDTYTSGPPTAHPGTTPTTPTPPPMRSIADPTVQAADAWLQRFQAALVGIMAAVAGAVGAVAFYTSFEAIRSYASTSGGITPEHAWAIPLLVDSFIVVATGADLWLSVHQAQRAWWEVAWPKALLGGAAAVSFVLNVAHAQAGDWPARGVAAIPPAALVLSVELLVMIVRRAAIARTTRRTTASPANAAETTLVVRGDQATTMVAPVGDQPALEATKGDRHTRANHRPAATNLIGGHQPTATSDQPRTTAAKATSGNATSAKANGGATYQRVRDLYLGGVTVAAEIARELGVSASYAQRTLRRVKAGLDRQQEAPATGAGRAATPERTNPAEGDQRDQTELAARSHDHLTLPEREHRDQVTDRTETIRDGDGRTTTTNSDRHLTLVAPDRQQDRGKAER
jgi:Protein of unknown function (DUF2637)